VSFKIKVIEIVKKIPRGKVTTYGTIATLAGLPRGARLVGGILHFSTEENNLPWQRIIALRASRSVAMKSQAIINRHGYISTKCLDHPKPLQKALLEQEGIEVSSDFMVDLKKYGWDYEKYLDNR
jgi:methylated-DNA-protein-cysteine methyltransferase related protein